ncbi:MAG TPA: histidine--tRNA ligase [Afifellaceae bacterium]|nr:histidine--tRNA ligase [Afifellaceae bacterium]
MSGKQKDQKLKARLPRGFEDRLPANLRAVTRMMATISAVYESYGFEPVETPFIEYTDALGKFLPDQDRPNEGVFSFQDDDEQWLSLRYDLTAPLARFFAENIQDLPRPYRSYRSGWVFRNEKPGPGRFRQFMQFDADTVGSASPAADAEICMMSADTMEALGIPRGDYVIRVNNRKVLDGVMESIGLAGDHHNHTRLVVLRAIDKLDRLGADGVSDLLGEGREDESGAFTPGAGLDGGQIDAVLAYVASRKDDDAATVAGIRETISKSETGMAGCDELAGISTLVAAAGYDDGRVIIDPSVVRGLEYYTGPVFEAELTFQVQNEKGQPVVFGSVGGGGRYDGLVGRFRGEDVPATGFSIGVSRLATALRLTGRLGDGEEAGPVVVTVMDRERTADYMAMAAKLRAAGIRAEAYVGTSGMKAQFKYADRRNAPCAIIQGEDERQAGKVQIKDMIEGRRQAAKIADHAEWQEERPGQFEVDEADLVRAVADLLKRQAEDAG